MTERSEFRTELAALINKHSLESASNTPDFILASYLTACLAAFEVCVVSRDKWYCMTPCPGKGNDEARDL